MKRIHAFVFALVLIAFVMTIGAFFAVNGQGSESRDFKIWELPNQPPPRAPHDRIRFNERDNT